jgi:DNA-binding FadR family transcriptional regulator
VVDQIQDAILEGRLKPGDMLPSEIKLKEMFATSRGTIREALRVLEQKGLIDIKTGVAGGAVVKQYNSDKITESFNLLIQTQDISFDHLAEFREEIEGIVTAMAAEKAGKRDIEILNDILSEAKGLLKNSSTTWQEYVEIDSRMHIAFSEVAGNPLYSAVVKMVHESIMGSHERYSLYFSIQKYAKESIKDLTAMVKAVERGQVEEARLLAKKHVRKFNQIMKETQGKQVRTGATSADKNRPAGNE